jgi:glycosyltransferase involved in cell wall biosynthesis
MFIGAAGSTPRGIDRVDMGYATHIFAASSANVGLVPSLGRMGVLTNREAARLVARVEQHWREDQAPADDAQLDLVRRRLADQPAPPSRGVGRMRAARIRTARRYGAMFADARWSSWRRAARAVPEGAVYVNTGQFLLGWPWFFGWLDRRPDVKPVFMMHDLIPLLYPEYSGPILSRLHARAVRTVARRAVALIATSRASGDEIREAVARLGRRDLPVHVAPLPVSDSLIEGRNAPDAGIWPELAVERPYFVTIGNIDQRKNHVLLVNVWREMLRRGVAVPKLVIVGSRGLRSAELIDALYRTPGLAAYVIETNGLSTPAMRELIRGARAVLMPSFTEGFGLPVLESLALGTPVIASDIPAHREVGGALCAYLDPLDGLGWTREVLARAQEGEDAVRARRVALAPYRPQSWRSYFGEVLPFLQSL